MMMNKMREIYGVVNMILFPEDEDPEMLSLELFSSFAKAKERSEEIIKEFIDDYGTDRTREIGDKLIKKSIDEIDNESFRKSVEEKINKISKGTRDLRF